MSGSLIHTLAYSQQTVVLQNRCFTVAKRFRDSLPFRVFQYNTGAVSAAPIAMKDSDNQTAGCRKGVECTGEFDKHK